MHFLVALLVRRTKLAVEGGVVDGSLLNAVHQQGGNLGTHVTAALVAVMTVPVVHPKVPNVLILGKIFHNQARVLVGLFG